MTHYDCLKIFYHSVQIGRYFTSSLENVIYNSLLISQDVSGACILGIFSRPVFETVIDESNMKENSDMIIFKRAVDMTVNFFLVYVSLHLYLFFFALDLVFCMCWISFIWQTTVTPN